MIAANPPIVKAKPVGVVIQVTCSPAESRQYRTAPLRTVSAATTGNMIPILRRFMRCSMNGCPATPSAATVGCRKKEATIVPPNQIIADPTWMILKKMSRRSITILSLSTWGCLGSARR